MDPPIHATLYLYLEPPSADSLSSAGLPLFDKVYEPDDGHRGWAPVYVGQTLQTLRNRHLQHRWWGENKKGQRATRFDIELAKNDTLRLVVLEQSVFHPSMRQQAHEWMDEREKHYIQLHQTYVSDDPVQMKRGLNMDEGGRQSERGLQLLAASRKIELIKWTDTIIPACLLVYNDGKGDLNKVKQDYKCPRTRYGLGAKLTKLRCGGYIPTRFRDMLFGMMGLSLENKNAQIEEKRWVPRMQAFELFVHTYKHARVPDNYVCPVTKEKLGRATHNIRSSHTPIPMRFYHRLVAVLKFSFEHQKKALQQSRYTHTYMPAFEWYNDTYKNVDVGYSFECPTTPSCPTPGLKLGCLVYRIRKKHTSIPDLFRHRLLTELRLNLALPGRTQEDRDMEEMEKFVAQHKHANVPWGWPGSTQMKVPLGKRVIQWRHHCVPGVTISARHCQSLIYKHAFMFSCTNLAVHVYKCLQQTDPDFPLETLRTADPWAPQPTPVEAQMNRLLSIVAARHPTWLATADHVPFGKKPLDVKARYRKDVAKALASKTLGKRKR
jgi:hypothetical protein